MMMKKMCPFRPLDTVRVLFFFFFFFSLGFDPVILNISLLLVLNVIAVDPETYKDTIQVARGFSKSRKPLDDGPGKPFFMVFFCPFNPTFLHFSPFLPVLYTLLRSIGIP